MVSLALWKVTAGLLPVLLAIAFAAYAVYFMGTALRRTLNF